MIIRQLSCRNNNYTRPARRPSRKPAVFFLVRMRVSARGKIRLACETSAAHARQFQKKTSPLLIVDTIDAAVESTRDARSHSPQLGGSCNNDSHR